LFAFGFDAFRWRRRLRRGGATRNISLEGLTGPPESRSERHVRRELGWAQLHNGELRLLPRRRHDFDITHNT